MAITDQKANLSVQAMAELSEEQLANLQRLNHLRYRAGTQSDRLCYCAELEALIEREFGAASRLAVYGSLAPGQANHHILSEISGQWQAGLFVRGHLVQQGWGVELGFPALRWVAHGSPVDIWLFVSANLPQHWARLDEFEGADYQRILVPVFDKQKLIRIANLYALPPGDSAQE